MYENDDDTLLPPPVESDLWEIPEPLEYWTLEEFPELPGV
jgi:hypothetical protein